MTPYENMGRTVEFAGPERLALRFPTLGLDDTYGVPLQPAATWQAPAPNVDEWHCVWHKPDPASGITNMGQPKGHPLASLEALDGFAWPDAHDPNRYAAIEAALAGAGDRYVMVGLGFTFFERMHYLYGMDDLFVAMYEQPQRVHELAERVVSFPIAVAGELGRRFRGRIHGFAMTDDWGTQQAAFVRIPMWREFFKERYARLFAAIHAAGMHAWMHSCGHVHDVIEGWIDSRLDVVNLQQPRDLGIEQIGARYRGRICFESLCDIQMTLPFATDAQVREEARLLLEHWSTPRGGFVLGDYGDGAAIGVTPQRRRVMLARFLELGAPGMAVPSATVARG